MHKKKKRGYLSSSLIPHTRPSHAHLPRISNAEAHADVYTQELCITHHWTMATAFTVRKIRICEVLYAADKTFRSTPFLLCPVPHPLTHQGLGWLTMQIYNFFLTFSFFLIINARNTALPYKKEVRPSLRRDAPLVLAFKGALSYDSTFFSMANLPL